jgi:glycosyltransferase involved in cell wall biosynthesis
MFGGTETMSRIFHQNFFSDVPNLKKYNCLILPGIVPSNVLNDSNEIIIWIHNTIDQFGELQEILLSDNFKNKIKHIIVVSKFHKKYIMDVMKFPENKISIVNNIVFPIEYDYKKFIEPQKIKIIHTSDPTRGMVTLLKSLKHIEDDFDLEIYNNFDPEFIDEKDSEFYKACNDKRVTFFGKTPKKTVVDALKNSHIHAYPSEFVETFCLSQAEAMSAGLLCVYSNVGSLYEISNNFGLSYQLPKNQKDHEFVFAKKLKEAIKIIKTNMFNPEYQVSTINKKYSLDNARNQWIEFNKKI